MARRQEPTVPHGPVREEVRDVPDLTRILDPEVLWPTAESCPDWPLQGRAPLDEPGAFQMVGREAALSKLEHLHQVLHRGEKTHSPTTQETAAALESHFTEGYDSGWYGARIGVTNYAPRTLARPEVPSMIAEATHLRGFLRKLDSRAAKAAGAADESARGRLQDRVDAYSANLASRTAELQELAEAAARHEQRISDEKAWRRARELKTTLEASYRQAAAAADQLGLQPPSAPPDL